MAMSALGGLWGPGSCRRWYHITKSQGEMVAGAGSASRGPALLGTALTVGCCPLPAWWGTQEGRLIHGVTRHQGQ